MSEGRIEFVDIEGKYHLTGDIVWVHRTGYWDPPDVEFIAHLKDLEAIWDYVGQQFPNGWTIVDGKLIDAHMNIRAEEKKRCEHVSTS